MKTTPATASGERTIRPTESADPSRLDTGGCPHTHNLVGEGDIRANWERLAAEAFRPGRFERGLERLLDGIEMDMQRRKGRKGPFRRS